MKTAGAICNISSTKLIESDISVLNKGLNFALSTKEPNKEQLLDDLYFFCRNLKLKKSFVVAIVSLAKYSKKKDVVLKPNFQIATSTHTMKHL